MSTGSKWALVLGAPTDRVFVTGDIRSSLSRGYTYAREPERALLFDTQERALRYVIACAQSYRQDIDLRVARMWPTEPEWRRVPVQDAKKYALVNADHTGYLKRNGGAVSVTLESAKKFDSLDEAMGVVEEEAVIRFTRQRQRAYPADAYPADAIRRKPDATPLGSWFVIGVEQSGDGGWRVEEV